MLESPLRTREELFQEAKNVLSENEHLKEFKRDESPYRIFIPLFKGGNGYVFVGKPEESPKWPVATFSIERRKDGVEPGLKINARNIEGDLEVFDRELADTVMEVRDQFLFTERTIRHTVERLIGKRNPAFDSSILELEYLNQEEIDREVEATLENMGHRRIRHDDYFGEIFPPMEGGDVGYAKIEIGIADVGRDDLGDVCVNTKTILYFQKVKF